MSHPNSLKAESYIDHMLIAARCGDKSSGLWRNLFDNWNCYSRGHPFIAKGGEGQPHWFNKANVNKHGAALLAMHRRSRLADEIIQRQSSEFVVVDHAVPVNVLRDMLLERGDKLSRDDVVQFLDAYYRLCVLTDEEHKRLNKGEHHSARPEPSLLWNRYSSAGIELID